VCPAFITGNLQATNKISDTHLQINILVFFQFNFILKSAIKVRFDVKTLIKKRIYYIFCKIFVSKMASEILKFNIFTTKICKNIL
jgi:hypothetical protein